MIGRRILVVEDEALIAIEMKETLTALGFAVVGPVSTIAQAMAALREAAFDGAILDLNLGGQLTYPVAERLAALRIPFIFVTGYRSDAIDGAYADVAVLEKPIDARRLGLLLVDGMAGDAASLGSSPAEVAGAFDGSLRRLG